MNPGVILALVVGAIVFLYLCYIVVAPMFEDTP